jgi:hypothetical protein
LPDTIFRTPVTNTLGHFGGKGIGDNKFKRIKPMFERARESGASSSSAPLPLDATEPRLELELASADNLMAIA